MPGKFRWLGAGLIFLLIPGFSLGQPGADIPPMLETQRPLETKESTTPTPPSLEKLEKAESQAKKVTTNRRKKKKRKLQASRNQKSRKAAAKRAQLAPRQTVYRNLQGRSEAKTADRNL
jgi:hypothetical protein